jgi:hypothetical protein
MACCESESFLMRPRDSRTIARRSRAGSSQITTAMLYRALNRQRSAFFVAVLALLGSCTESVTVNAPGGVSLSVGGGTNVSIDVNDGNQQTGVAGTTLMISPSVMLRGRILMPLYGMPLLVPVRATLVHFVVQSGGGHVAEPTTVSNEDGIASAGGWTLGPEAGTQTISAHLVIDGVRSDSVVFYATATESLPNPPPEEEPPPPLNQKPVASFTVTRLGDICTFDGSGSTDDAGIVTYMWRSSEAARPPQSGSVVTRDCGSQYAPWIEWLIVQDAGGLVDSTSRAVTPAPAPPTPPGEQPPAPPTNQKPVASFTVTRAGEVCTFDGSGSTDDEGIVSYTWRSSDASRSVKSGSIVTRSCNFGDAPWTEWLTVQDAGGLVDSTSRAVASAPVPPPPTGGQPTNQKPVASFTVTRVGEVCTFDGSGSTDDKGIVTYMWRSSDVKRRAKQGLVITRGCSSIAAPWTEWLTVQDAAGLVDSTSRVVSTGLASPPPGSPAPPTGTGDIRINAATRYQTITGWEAHSQSGEGRDDFQVYSSKLFDDAVFDLGITRLRVEVRPSFEHTRDLADERDRGLIDDATLRCLRYTTVNDNDDPFTINWSGFRIDSWGDAIKNVVLPIKQRVESRGEKFFLNITYVAFTDANCAGTSYVHDDTPEEYAEFVLAVYTHLRNKYNIIPDSWETILEPNVSSIWNNPTLVGRSIAAAGRRLQQNGFTPRFIAPSTSVAWMAVQFFDQILQVPGAQQYITELSYHRYDGNPSLPDATVRGIGDRASQRNINSSMLERLGASYEELHQDLEVGQVSAWQQYALAFGAGSDNGDQYFLIQGTGPGTTLKMGSRTRFLRQYFRYIRPGAVRVAVTSGKSEFHPLAFINKNGKYAVVVKADASGSFTVGGLPAGQYGITYTTATQSLIAANDVSLAQGQNVTASIPAKGVITIFAK